MGHRVSTAVSPHAALDVAWLAARAAALLWRQDRRGCRIAPTCSIWAPWNLEIGDYTAIADGVDVYAMARITLGSKVTISQRSFLCTGTHDTRSLLRPLVTREIVIKDHVWVAAEAFIHPGCVLEEGCVVGARSVVTADLPAWMICVGAPCRALKPRDIAL